MKRLVNVHPGGSTRLLLGVLPFLLLALIYQHASDARLAENASDRLLPAFTTMASTFVRLATEADVRSGLVPLWADTAASLKRLVLGVGIAALAALITGIALGLVPVLRAQLSPLLSAISLVPPMALLPILFVVVGLGETAKVTLIVVGIAPYLMRDLLAQVRALPEEQIVKAQTLSAGTWLLALHVVLPQVAPRLIEGIRLALGPAWLFLIAAEAIASTEGLGYRIFLMRRYMAMDAIVPYVIWLTLIACAADTGLKILNRRCFPWYFRAEEKAP